MRDNDSLPSPSTASSTAENGSADRAEAALLLLAQLLGRQAARDWLSADLCPPEGHDDE